MRGRSLPLVLVALLILGLSVAACSSSGGSSTPDSSHTVSMGGVAHMDGYRNPTANCTGSSCHGADLNGGAGPGCNTCH